MFYNEEKINNINKLYDTLIKSNVKDRKIENGYIGNIKINIEKIYLQNSNIVRKQI